MLFLNCREKSGGLYGLCGNLEENENKSQLYNVAHNFTWHITNKLGAINSTSQNVGVKKKKKSASQTLETEDNVNFTTDEMVQPRILSVDLLSGME